jgi:hypothetical protein
MFNQTINLSREVLLIENNQYIDLVLNKPEYQIILLIIDSNIG